MRSLGQPITGPAKRVAALRALGVETRGDLIEAVFLIRAYRTTLDVLNAEQELLNSQVQLVAARRNAYVAGFTLLAAMGRAEAEDLGLEGGTLYDPLTYYDDVRGRRGDWSREDDPLPVASRTVDTVPQTAPIEPLSEDIGPGSAARNLYGPRRPID